MLRTFLALLWKQWLLKIRRPCQTTIELVLPILLVVGIIVGYLLAEVTEVDAAEYVSGSNLQAVVPFAAFPYLASIYGWKLALVAEEGTNAQKKIRDNFGSRMESLFPGWKGQDVGFATDTLRSIVVPPMKDVITKFDSNADLESYMLSQEYDTDEKPRVMMAVVFAEERKYTIRVNNSELPATTTETVDLLERSQDTAMVLDYLRYTGGSVFGGERLEYVDKRRPKSSREFNANGPGFVSLQFEVDRAILDDYNEFNESTTSYALSGASPVGTVSRLTQLYSAMGVPFSDIITESYAMANATYYTKIVSRLANVALRSDLYPPNYAVFSAFPSSAYKVSSFYSAVASLFPIFFVIAASFTLLQLMNGLVSEKEAKVREGMAAMGLNSILLHSTWYIAYSIEMLLISLFVALSTINTVFAKSEWGIVFLLFFLFSLASLSFFLFLSTFFAKTRTAVIGSFLIFIALWFVDTAVSPAGTPYSARAWACLAVPTAFSRGLNHLVSVESSGLGADLTTASLRIDGWSTADSMGFLAMDAVLFLILAWYADEVMPSFLRGWGVPRPWYFPCQRSYWIDTCGYVRVVEHHDGGKEGEKSKAVVEPPNADLRALASQDKCIKVRGLTKDFGAKKLAVNRLDLDIYEGQVTALLGHNGAGKTTTISMITGMLNPTAGDVSIYGKSILTDMASIRQDMGVCPQHDVLFPDMTVREHMQLFCAIKGIAHDKMDEEIRKGIQEIGLTEKIDVHSRHLSGGQKRKLSVAIALLGGSKVVLLDEPTSGMDPFSRKSCHQAILNARRGRILLLVTHFMEEADALGDRIAIMADGELRCCGSSNFLKRKYGVGYSLTMTKEDRCNEDAVTERVHQAVPGAALLSNVGTELSFRLPMASSPAFPALFRDFDGDIAKPPDAQRFGIQQYGVSVTTMEEVFLRVAEGRDRELMQVGGPPAALAIASGNGAGAVSPSGDEEGSGAAGSNEGSRSAESLARKKKREDEGVSIQSVRQEAREEAATAPFIHFLAVFIKRFHYYRRDARSFICQIVLPGLIVLLGLAIVQASIALSYPRIQMSTGYLNLDPDTGENLPNRAPMLGFMSGIGTTAKAPILGDIKNKVPNTTTLFTLYRDLPDTGLAKNLNLSTSPTIDTGLALSQLLLDERDKYEASFYGAYAFPRTLFPYSSNTTKTPYPPKSTFEYMLLANTTAFHGVPTFANLMASAYAKETVGGSPIELYNEPMPLTFTQRGNIEGATTFTSVLMILLGFLFIPTSWAITIVKEREVGVKHQELISGMTIPSFWLATWLWDVVSYQIPCWLTLAILAGYSVSNYLETEDDSLTATCLILFLSGLAMASFTYAVSFALRTYTTALIVMLVIGLVSFILVLVSFILSFIPNTCQEERIIREVFRIFPLFNMGEGLFAIATRETLPFNYALCFFENDDEFLDNFLDLDMKRWDNAMDAEVAGNALTALGWNAAAYLAIAILLDYILSNQSWVVFFNRLFCGRAPPPPPPTHVDEDVEREERRVKEEGPHDDDLILLDDVRKVYPGGKYAVRGVSFAVKVGEVMGFLGVNGAGKTSTLKILSGEAAPSDGRASLAGYDVLNEQLQCRRLIGYCPQFDALTDLLTVREHLEYFARVKLVAESEIENVVQTKMREMDLLDYEHVQSMSLSGGNKRKLSVAIALIGDPPVVFLDEPSTGMDPVSRRRMWEIISEVATARKSCSIILTTHSMEECAALCQRVGIMVSGRLRCIGGITHLQHRFGQGYSVEVVLNDPTEEEVTRVCEQVTKDGSALLHQSSDRTLAARAEGREGGVAAPGSSHYVKRADVPKVLELLKMPDLVHELHPLGTGWAVYSEMMGDRDGVGLDTLIPWVLQEQRAGEVFTYLRDHAFPAPPDDPTHHVTLTERHSTLLDFNVPRLPGITLADMFERLEQAKDRLGIQSFAVSATTLEQIFNSFAKTQEEEDVTQVRGVIVDRGSRGAGGAGEGAGASKVPPSKGEVEMV